MEALQGAHAVGHSEENGGYSMTQSEKWGREGMP